MTFITDSREAATDEIRFALGTFSLGIVLVAVSPKGVAALFLGDDHETLVHELTRAFPQARLAQDEAGLEEMVAKVVTLIEAPPKGLDLPLDIRGSALEQAVWTALRTVSSCETVTYGEIAKTLPLPATAQEVGAACAANVLAVAIPAIAWSRRTARSPATAGACGARGC